MGGSIVQFLLMMARRSSAGEHLRSIPTVAGYRTGSPAMLWQRAARLALVVYLLGYLTTGAPLSSQVWARGGHATREQWVYHTVLMRLGVLDHHEPTVGWEVPEHSRPHTTGTIVALVSLISPIVTAPSTLTFLPDTILYLAAGALLMLAPAEAWRRLAPPGDPILAGIRPEPPEKPPSFQR